MTKDKKAEDIKAGEEPGIDSNWIRMQREWHNGGLRVLNEMINSANLVQANTIPLDALVKKRDSIDQELKELNE